jgi:hypothetical protein
MDHETKNAELLEQVERQMEEFELLVPRLRAMGDVHVSLPMDLVEAICRPTTTFYPPMPMCALRA